MIYGVGTDIIEVDRVAEKVADNMFMERVFTRGEIAYCNSKHRSAEHFAARFAAKEAFFKATGQGWVGQFGWKEVEVVRNDDGKPSIQLSGRAQDWRMKEKISDIHLSLSHLKENANAIVILEVR